MKYDLINCVGIIVSIWLRAYILLGCSAMPNGNPMNLNVSIGTSARENHAWIVATDDCRSLAAIIDAKKQTFNIQSMSSIAIVKF